MIAVFYFVLCIALFLLGILFYILFRRRISLRIFRAKGYLGILIFAFLFVSLLTSAVIYGSRTLRSTDSGAFPISAEQQLELADWLREYRSHSDALYASYQSAALLLDKLERGDSTAREGEQEADRLLRSIERKKESFAAMHVLLSFPETTKVEMSRLLKKDQAAYQQQVELLAKMRALLHGESAHDGSEEVSEDTVNRMRLLLLEKVPPYRDTSMRLAQLAEHALLAK